MRLFRGLLAIVFAGILFFGLWKWYSTEYSVSEKDFLLPVREKLANAFTPREETKKISSKKPARSTNANNVKASLHPDVTQGVLSQAQYTKFVESTRLFGNSKGKYLMAVMCDYEVGYCKDLINNDVPGQYAEYFSNNLGYVFKPFPKSKQSKTLYLYNAYACAQDNADISQLLDLQVYLHKNNTPSLKAVNSFAKRSDIGDIKECIENQATTLAVQSQRASMKELFSIKSLPTFVFINTQTSERYALPGLYEFEEIEGTLKYISGQ